MDEDGDEDTVEAMADLDPWKNRKKILMEPSIEDPRIAGSKTVTSPKATVGIARERTPLKREIGIRPKATNIKNLEKR